MNLKLLQTDYDKTFQEFVNFVMPIELSKNENYMISKVQVTVKPICL